MIARQHRLGRLGRIACTACAVMLLATGCGSTTVKVGQTVKPDGALSMDRDISVTIPYGQLQIHLTGPKGDITATGASYSGEEDVVGLSWTFVEYEAEYQRAIRWDYRAKDSNTKDFALSLRYQNAQVPIRTAEGDQVLAGVPSDGSAKLAIEYDKKTEQVDMEKGQSGGNSHEKELSKLLKKPDGVRDRNEFNNPCPKAQAASDDIDAVCSAADVVEVPYIRGLGWAPDGMAFAVTTVTGYVSAANGGQADPPTVRLRLDGVGSEKAAWINRTGDSFTTAAAFVVKSQKSHALQVMISYDGKTALKELKTPAW